jgi:hypothetical protein
VVVGTGTGPLGKTTGKPADVAPSQCLGSAPGRVRQAQMWRRRARLEGQSQGDMLGATETAGWRLRSRGAKITVKAVVALLASLNLVPATCHFIACNRAAAAACAAVRRGLRRAASNGDSAAVPSCEGGETQQRWRAPPRHKPVTRLQFIRICASIAMNTKRSVMYGWVAYTAAFAVGGAIGWHRYYYKPGGRKDREEAVETEEAASAAADKRYEEEVRRARRTQSAESNSQASNEGNGGATGKASNT